LCFQSYAQQSNEKAFLGINYNQISHTKAKKLGFDNPYGSYVSHVIDNTAAENSGIKAFDYIYGIDGKQASDDQGLTCILSKYSAGDQANVMLIRNGRKLTKAVVFGERRKSSHQSSDKCNYAFLGIRQQSKDENIDGVKVSIVSNSTAANINLQDGDIVQYINDHVILDWSDVKVAIGNLSIGEEIEVRVLRGDQQKTQNGKIKSQCDEEETKAEQQSYSRDDDDFATTAEYDYDQDQWENHQSVDLRSVNVSIKDMDNTASASLNDQYGIGIPTSNNLSISQLKISPNASSGLFQLEFMLPQSGSTHVQVYNSAGRIIYDYDLGQFTGSFKDDIDLTQNGMGKYFLHIKQGSRSLAKEIELK
jgi:hypothetical protein